MQEFAGHLRKMGVELLTQPVELASATVNSDADSFKSSLSNVNYSLLLDDQRIPLNGLLGRRVSLKSVAEISCICLLYTSDAADES